MTKHRNLAALAVAVAIMLGVVASGSSSASADVLGGDSGYHGVTATCNPVAHTITVNSVWASGAFNGERVAARLWVARQGTTIWYQMTNWVYGTVNPNTPTIGATGEYFVIANQTTNLISNFTINAPASTWVVGAEFLWYNGSSWGNYSFSQGSGYFQLYPQNVVNQPQPGMSSGYCTT